MQGKIVPIAFLAAIVVGGVGFYGGTVYEKKSLSSQGMLRDAASTGRQGGSGQGQMQGRPFGNGSGSRGEGGGPNGGGFVTGDIIGKDAQSITVKMRDGGCKIVYYSASTTIGKTAAGTADDLSVGESVQAFGVSGQDGTVAAQSIQIRPEQQSGQR
jgi:hypothetical protein